MKHTSKLILSIFAVIFALALTSCASGETPANQPDEEVNMLADTKWDGESDYSQIHFSSDGTFRFYRYKDDYSDSYYEGTYLFFIGAEAVTYITEDLASYGVTREDWMNTIDKYEMYDVSNTVCLILNNTACIIDGENTVSEPYTTPYMGFYYEEYNYLDLANMNTANYSGFALVTDEG